MPKKLYKVKCYWQVCGTLEIEAENANDAREQALAPNTELPTESSYIMDSFEVPADEVEELTE